MSKLFGQVGRVDNKSTCPNLFLSILGYQVGRVHPIWTYVQNFVVFFLNPFLRVCFKTGNQEDSSYEDMMHTTLEHFKMFFAANSTLMRGFEDVRFNLSTALWEGLKNSSVLKTWNETLQETINTIQIYSQYLSKY